MIRTVTVWGKIAPPVDVISMLPPDKPSTTGGNESQESGIPQTATFFALVISASVKTFPER